MRLMEFLLIVAVVAVIVLTVAFFRNRKADAMYEKIEDGQDGEIDAQVPAYSATRPALGFCVLAKILSVFAVLSIIGGVVALIICLSNGVTGPALIIPPVSGFVSAVYSYSLGVCVDAAYAYLNRG